MKRTTSAGKRTTSTGKRTTSARKRTTRTKSKGLRLSRQSKRQILITGAVVVGIILIIALLLKTHPAGVKKKAGKEIGRNAVYGKVIGVNVGSTPRGTIRVKSLNTGKVYTFYLGWRTKYYPSRYPYVGEKVKVYYVYDRGYLKATRVKIR